MATFKFDPETGLCDRTVFPTYPEDEVQARLMFQTPLNQIRDFINNSIVVNMSGWITFKENGGTIAGSIGLGDYADTDYKSFDVRRTVNGKGTVAKFGVDTGTSIGVAGMKLVEYPTGSTIASLLLSNVALYTAQNLDLGSETNKWQSGYFEENMNVDKDLTVGGNSVIKGTLKVGDNVLVENATNSVMFKGLASKPVTISVLDDKDVTINGVVLDAAKSFRPTSTLKEQVDLGSSTYKFKDGYFSGNVNVGEVTKSTDGYNTMNNGMIEQWGSISVTNNSAKAVTLPIAFANACLNVQLTPSGSSNITSTPCVSGLSKTGFSIFHNHSSALTIHWRAIGY